MSIQEEEQYKAAIRSLTDADLEQVLAIWQEASTKAHYFVEPAFWQTKLAAMRDLFAFG